MIFQGLHVGKGCEALKLRISEIVGLHLTIEFEAMELKSSEI